MTKKRWIVALGVATLFLAGAAWQFQSRILGLAARVYLQRIAAAEERSGDVSERQKVVLGLHRALLLQPPPAALVPELYDVTTILAERAAAGEISWNWSAYLYTSYMRDAVGARPKGEPRRSPDEVRAAVDQSVRFFSIRRRPDEHAMGVADVFGVDDQSFTVDEIDAAHEQGRDLGWAGAQPQTKSEG